MIRASVRTGLLGEEVEHVDVPIKLARTPRQLLERVSGRLSKSVPIGVSVDGQLVSGGELDRDLVDGQHLIFAPQTGYGYGETIVSILIQLAISAVISYVAYVLSPRPKPAGVAQDRGDDSSSTYAWDGVKTNYGPGLPIPWGYGRHPVGGQAIWTDVEASRSASGGFVDDRFRIVLSLVDGQIHRVGDVPATSLNGVGSGSFPDHVRVNGNLIPVTGGGATAWIRPGTQDQPALPAPFAGVSQTFSPQGALNDGGDTVTFTFADASEIAVIGFVFTFPAGLYKQLPTGALEGAGVLLNISARIVNTGATIQLPFIQIGQGGAGTTPYVGYHAESHRIELGTQFTPAPFSGPVEITVTRGTPSFGTEYVTQCVWRDLVVITPHTLRYPQEALLALELQAGERFQGGLPNITVRCDLALVRVWDEESGWSPRCWDVPAAPFDFHTYAPGRNPAWCLLDFLLARWGLGRWLTEDDIDLPAFRRWAIMCDQDPNPGDPWGEPQFTVDIIGDKPRPVWEWVLTFCSAGRATPVMRDGKISIVYQYRDAHTDGVVSVPAKEPTQLITSGNCEDVVVTWRSKKNRPTVYQFQFLNEDDDYTQDVLPVEDDEGSVNDPSAFNKDRYHAEDVQAYGVTRPSQLFREGVWRHRIQRTAIRQLEFTTGPWMLASETGDVFEFEHEMLRPFGDDAPVSMQVTGGGEGTVVFVVDHHLGGSSLEVVWRDANGKPQRSAIDSYVNGESGGKKISVVNVPGLIDIPIGVTCVIGEIDKLVQPYEIVAIDQGKNQKRRVRSIEWTPDAYDPISKDEYESDFGGADSAKVLDTPSLDDLPPSVLGIRLVADPDGGHRITWARPASKAGSQTRVYVRPVDGPMWVLVGSTEIDEIRATGLRVGVSYQVSICLENRTGRPVPADLGDQATLTPEEFPPYQLPKLTNVRATVIESGVLLQWDELQQRDLEYFEVRAGSSWAAAPVLTRERAARALIIDPPAGVPLLVAARSRSGLYGGVTVVPSPTWSPPATVSAHDVDDFATSPAGTHSDTIWDAGDQAIELAVGRLSGTYESLEQDVGYQAPFFWRVLIDRREIEDVTLGDLDFELGSGEARWRTLEGRPASPYQPGVDWQHELGDFEGPLGDLPSTLMLGGHMGEVGSHTRVLVESRFYVNGAWTDYLEHVDRVVVASRMQVRLTLNRRTTGFTARATKLTYQAYL